MMDPLGLAVLRSRGGILSGGCLRLNFRRTNQCKQCNHPPPHYGKKKLCKANPSLEVVAHNLLHRRGWARKIGSQLSKRHRVMGMSCDLAAFPASSMSLRYIERVSIALGQWQSWSMWNERGKQTVIRSMLSLTSDCDWVTFGAAQISENLKQKWNCVTITGGRFSAMCGPWDWEAASSTFRETLFSTFHNFSHRIITANTAELTRRRRRMIVGRPRMARKGLGGELRHNEHSVSAYLAIPPSFQSQLGKSWQSVSLRVRGRPRTGAGMSGELAPRP